MRSYINENISNQQLLEVLWLSYGYSNDHRNIPKIGDDYSLIIYAVNATGSYQYVPENNSLVIHDLMVNKETIRSNDQNWPSDASVVLVVVWNQTRMSNGYFASAEAGCLVQNVYLAAASLNLGTCCVGNIDSPGLRDNLKLFTNLTPLLVMPLGFPTDPYPPASPNYNLMVGNLPDVQFSMLSFEDTLRNMQFTQNWSTENLSSQEISQLLWAAYGYTNVTSGTTYHRTTPSAYGIYPLVIFLSNATGVYQYLPENHSIAKILSGDKRFEIADACASQTWAAKAPAIFLILYNSLYNGGNTGDGGILTHEFIEVNAGSVIQQLFLEAAAWNLSANIVSNGLEDWNGTGATILRNILDVSSSNIPLYVVPVGTQVPDTIPPTIGTPSQEPNQTAVEPSQNVTITVYVSDEETGIREVILFYSINGGQTWITITMNNISHDTYMGEIPGFEADTSVLYRIVAFDKANNQAIEDRNGEYYTYTVIPEYQELMIILFIVTTILVALISTKTKKHSQK